MALLGLFTRAFMFTPAAVQFVHQGAKRSAVAAEIFRSRGDLGLN
jgi:hypothetical protein